MEKDLENNVAVYYGVFNIKYQYDKIFTFHSW